MNRQWQAYEKLKEKVGVEELDALIEFLDSNYGHHQFVTKQDLEEAVALLETQMVAQKSDTDAKLAQQDAKLAQLEVKIEKGKNEIIRWLIGFLIPLYLGMIGIFIKLFS